MTDTFGRTLRKLRTDARVGLRELARLVDKSAGYLSDVEQENVAPPSEELIVRIAAALGADKQELLSAASKMDPELSRYIAGEPQAADFLRRAKEKSFGSEDWKKLDQFAEIVELGKHGKNHK
ncbi:MAG: helix-turn-helix domain-containing protein [Hyphomicrobiales bacterium]